MLTSKTPYIFVILLAWIPFAASLGAYIFAISFLCALIGNAWITLVAVSLAAGSTVPVSMILMSKFGVTDFLDSDVGQRYYMLLQPWPWYRWVMRKRHPRKVFRVEDMSDEMFEALSNSKMDPKHDHLNDLMDEDEHGS